MKDIDLGWFRRHFVDDLLPNWHRAAVTDEGLFLTHLDRQWCRKGPEEGTLVSQSRLLYVFARGYELTGREEYLEAVRAGARFLMRHFRDREHGGWFWSCATGGGVLDQAKDCYGHAFVILGLSHASAVTGDGELAEAAAETWDVLASRFMDSRGGMRWHMTREFGPADRRLSHNPMMHLFEALLALGDLEGMERHHEHAVRVADFVVDRLARADGGALGEVYDLDWNELPAAGGGYVSVGHQFEWGYLLSSAAERGLGVSRLPRAAELVEAGLRIGFDAGEGGVVMSTSHEGEVRNAAKGWWEQCEAARALLHFAVVRGREDFVAPLVKTLDFIKRRFVDDEYGGWFARSVPAGPRGTDKGNPYKVGYHVAGMCLEAVRLSGNAGGSAPGRPSRGAP